MTQIRPLRLHDLPLAYRLVGIGVSFDAHISLTVGIDSLRQAVLAGTGRTQAYVLRHSQYGSGLGQLHYLSGTHYARLAYIAPSLAEGGNDTLWLHLLDGLAVKAGERGMVTIIAEVGEQRELECAVLRQAGFAAYTHQDLWLRQPAPVTSPAFSLRQAQNSDEAAIMALYGSLVPGLIKHVEPPPTHADHCYVLDEQKKVVGLAAVYDGTTAALVETYLALDSTVRPHQFLSGVLTALNADGRPVYFRVRDYMGCQTNVLHEAGFNYIGRQIVMYRHTATRIQQHSYRMREALDGSLPLPTAYDRSSASRAKPIT